MPVISKTHLVPYKPEQMFELVDNVQEYPEFMPWCGGAKIIERTDNTLIASVEINFVGITQSFTTKNTNTFPNNIQLSLVDGPFSSLSGNWKFLPLGDDACKIIFDLNYEFKSKTVSMIIGPVFNKIANSFIESFSKRAKEKYGEANF